jgi:predicted nucleic acid-binding protein
LGVDELDAFLGRHKRIALDTSIFIYQLEANAHYVALSDRVFSWIETSGHSAVTSTITMTELLVQPYRTLDQRRVDEIASLLSTYPAIDWIAPDLDIADLAARIRADHQLKIPDALQAATAISAKATAIVTNDPVFKRLERVEALTLDDIL